MKKMILTILMSLVLTTSLFAFAGGDGSSSNPYQVSTVAHLDSVRHYLDSNFVQVADIDLWVAPWNSGTGWDPIGNSTTAFTGNYDGGNFTISNLYINESLAEIKGLFGYIVTSTVENINLANVNVTGENYTGALVGYSYSASYVTNCSSTGSITGLNHVGGLIGNTDLAYTLNCSSSADVAGAESIGGLIGMNDESEITNSNSTGTVTATGYYSGVLAGYININSTISNCYSNGSVTGSYYIGGFAGYATSNTLISDCYSSGTLSGDYSGGFIGYTYQTTISNCYSDVPIPATGDVIGGFVGWDVGSTISNSYATGAVSGNDYVGGLFGYVDTSDIQNSYSTGSVTGAGSFGGLIGANSGSTATSCYWDTQTSGQATSALGIGKTTAQMHTQSTFIGWDYVTTPIWKIVDTLTYPYLAWQPNSTVTFTANPGGAGTTNGIDGDYLVGFAIDLLAEPNSNNFFINWTDKLEAVLSIDSAFTYIVTELPEDITANFLVNPFANGQGNSGNPYQVSTAQELNFVRNYLDAYFIQTADISLADSIWSFGEGWTPIGSELTKFTGNYNGDGYDIDSLTINKPSAQHIGLFGYADASVLENINVKDCDITANMTAGALVGYHRNNATISNCSSSGLVDGASFIGGLVGYHFNNASINKSYSLCDVTASGSQSGGLVAYTDGASISNSYFNGDVNCSNFVGGVTGYLINSTLTNSYSKGLVTGSTNVGGLVGYSSSSTTTSSYWDTETSGQVASAAGTGKTTAQMHTQSKFIGWDFISPVWYIHYSINNGYPYLEWEDRIQVEKPENIVISNSAGSITITWDAVAGADGYLVYSSNDPYGTFTIDVSGSFNGTEWTATQGATKMFYYVVAINPTK